MTFIRQLLFASIATLCAASGVGLQQAATSSSYNMPGTKNQDQTIRVQVRLVPVDVIVTDDHDRPITDLKKEDFVILDNGQPAEIRHFALQTLTPAALALGQQALRTTKSGDFAPQSARTFLIVMGRGWIDRPFKTLDAMIAWVRRALLPQDRVAVFAFNRATDFTADHEHVAQVIERFTRWGSDHAKWYALGVGPREMVAPFWNKSKTRG
jgi:VWFA-related protein